MTSTTLLILFLLFLILIFVVVFFVFLRKISQAEYQSKFESILKNELRDSRLELHQLMRDNRSELSLNVQQLTQKMEEKLQKIQEQVQTENTQNRTELTQSLKDFGILFDQKINELNLVQKQKFDALTVKQNDLISTTELKLEKMRETVDEKLHKTLEERLGQSFKLVSSQLEAVQKGLGEMQTLAHGVGDLKKVLSNVKSRGIMGEIQLGSLLEQILAPEQYVENVITKSGSNDRVEFAVKLPGKDDSAHQVYLPIDAKFPQEDYIRLQTAYDIGIPEGIETAKRALLQTVKKQAKDIRLKYIDPPQTTDFGILFLPFEGLYAEIVRHPELMEQLQRDFKIIVTGPSTLAAMLNSLQMGFRTLAIQKRSSEVWNVLGAVKTEFVKFGDVLEKAQKKLHDANKDLEVLVGTRTKMMLSKLKNVEKLPEESSKALLDEDVDG